MTSVLRKLLQLIIYLRKVHLWIEDVVLVFSYAIKIPLFNHEIGIKFENREKRTYVMDIYL